jgi:exopolyphosphatase/guanosine-5'-triphosphate,3'-diphosphate pyrophosphatase
MKFAAIDIGTNAARLLIGEVDKKGQHYPIKKHSYVRIPLRLGGEVFENGIISRAKAIEFMKSLHAFKLITEVYDVTDLRVCATSAMREARNALEIKDYVEQETGLTIEIISGQEEANLIFSTFSLLNIEKDTAYIVVDVGGGSTEVSVFEKGERVASKSFKIGTIRLLKKKADENIWEQIQNWLSKHVDLTSVHQIFATGGNINKAHKILGGKFMEPISLQHLQLLRDDLDKLTLHDRINNYQLKSDRADVIVHALDIYLYILKKLECHEIIVPKIGLSDGMIYNMFMKHSNLL